LDKKGHKRFKVITLGCKVNQYESASLKESLASLGWTPAGEGNPEVTVVNTCIVTQRAAHQSRQEIRKAVREAGEGRVVVTGCYAQAFPEEILRIEGVGLVVGNASKGKLARLLSEGADSGEKGFPVEGFPSGSPFERLPIGVFPERTRAVLKIQDGCESFCSYCIVPYARGPYRSLPEKAVLEEIRHFCEKGHKEIVLTGIHLGKYGFDLGEGAGLTSLLAAIGKEGFPARVRLSSLESMELEDALIEMAADGEWLCRHFHIPLQSGDDGILKRMNRPYGARHFEGLVGKIHGRSPLTCIGVDVMAGFPGEDEKAHGNTCSLIRDLPISYLHVFPFSPRRGTPAARFAGRVSPDELKRRAAERREIGRVKREAFYRSCLGKEFQVLAEGPASGGMTKGFTDNYLPVFFPSREPLENVFVRVRVEASDQNGVTGSLLSPF
jgi:threonylcarbamoyladenosine tRNA methylthiotransferase MtaB